MTEFIIVLQNVGLMLVYMCIGFILVKSKVGAPAHAKSVSGMLVYFCAPCMILSAFQSMTYSQEDFLSLLWFFLTTLVLQLIFFGLLFFIFRKKQGEAKYRILTTGAVMGNVGFIGMPIVKSIFPAAPIVACYSSVFVMSMNLVVFTFGVFMITNDKKFISLKSALCNPTSFAIYLSLPLYFLDFHLPALVGNAVTLLGNMSTPLCMIVLGMRLAAVPLKDLFIRPFVYITSALKLLVFPLFCYLCVVFLPFFDPVFKACILILGATPTAAVVLSLAELHQCEQELTANVVLFASLFSVITIPILILLI